MIIVDNVKDIPALNENRQYEIYVKKQNMKIWLVSRQIWFIELEVPNTYYIFEFRNTFDSIKEVLGALFRISDYDLAIYLLKHAYSSNDKSIDAVRMHPQYNLFFNNELFELGIKKWPNRLFSPFVVEKRQNLDTRMSNAKLVKAILAGQVKKVVCEGIYTDNWAFDEERNNQKGKMDPLDLAKEIYESNLEYFFSKEGNKLGVSYNCGEFYGSYKVLFK